MEGRVGKRRQFPRGVAVILHEHQVPDFDVPAARIARKGLALASGVGRLNAQVIMDFRARSARPGLAHLPEIVFLVQPEDAVFGYARHLLFVCRSASSSSRKTVT